MSFTNLLDEIFGGNDGGGRKPTGGSHSAFIAPRMAPSLLDETQIIFESHELFTGGNFTFSDFRLRLTSDDLVEIQTEVHFGKLKTGYKVAQSPIVAFAFADADGFFMPQKWVLDRFAKRCGDDEKRNFVESITIEGVFNYTKQLGASHSAWGFGYC